MPGANSRAKIKSALQIGADQVFPLLFRYVRKSCGVEIRCAGDKQVEPVIQFPESSECCGYLGGFRDVALHHFRFRAHPSETFKGFLRFFFGVVPGEKHDISLSRNRERDLASEFA